MKHRVGAKLLTTAIVVLFGLQAPACQQCDTLDENPILFTEGITDDAGTTYETTPIDGTWLHFPAGRRFDLRHNLRGRVITVQSYVSFRDRLSPEEEDEDDAENPNNFTESAGNLVVYEKSLDPQVIRIRNDSCENSLYVRIVATSRPETDLQSLGGAGGSDAVDEGGAGGASP
jgi:hypothetical protein